MKRDLDDWAMLLMMVSLPLCLIVLSTALAVAMVMGAANAKP